MLDAERPPRLPGPPATDPLTRVRSLGIDVGVTKGLDLVLMDERRVPLAVRSHVHLADVGALIDEFHPDIVAIDSPPRWAATGRSRRTERELASCNIQSFNTPSETHGRGNAFFDWMQVGFEVFRIANDHGFATYGAGTPRGRAMEVFPHATTVVLTGACHRRGSRSGSGASASFAPRACAPTS